MKTFPNTVYLTRENEETEDEFLNVSEGANNLAELGEQKVAAVYELKRVVVIETEVSVRAVDGNRVI